MTPFAIDAPDIDLAIAWIWRIMCNVHVRRLLKHNLSERSYRTHERALRKSPTAVSLLDSLLSEMPHMHGKIYTALKAKASTALTQKYFYNINYELHVHADCV